MNDEAELLWRLCNEEYSQARQHETQRASMTTIAITASVAAIGFITFDNKLSKADLPLAMVIIAIGVLGVVLTLKHYERSQFHIERARAYRSRLEDMYPATELTLIRVQATEEHKRHWGHLFSLRLYKFWLYIHILIVLLGAIILCLVMNRVVFK